MQIKFISNYKKKKRGQAYENVKYNQQSIQGRCIRSAILNKKV